MSETDNEEYICTKKAIRIRTVETHTAWPHIRNKIILFSKLTENGLAFYNQKSLDTISRTKITKNVMFFNHVDAEYGSVFIK